MHIGNLYKERDILLFKRCYASEKVHGTSAHVSIKVDKDHPTMIDDKGQTVATPALIDYFPGGEKLGTFKAFFEPIPEFEKRIQDWLVGWNKHS